MSVLEFLADHGQTAAALMGVYFSLFSLYVAIMAARFLRRQMTAAEEQAEIARQHNRLSVRPIIYTWIRSRGKEVWVEVENNGIGPAILTDVRIEGPNRFAMSVGYEANAQVLGTMGFRNFTTGKILEQTEPGFPFALKPGASLILLRIEGIAWDTDQADSFAANLRAQFSLCVDYESMYGERYKFGG